MNLGISKKKISTLLNQILIKIAHKFAFKSFKFVEKYLHLHITPAHYYSPIPMTNELDKNVYKKIFDCTGIDINVKKQLDYLENIFPKYCKEYSPNSNTGLSLVDAFILYSMIREKKPKVMIEIGAGDTTKISLKALAMNKKEGFDNKFYSIEPFPRESVKKITVKNFELIEKKLQEVKADLFESADIVFIDSTHVSKIDSDVNKEILEIIPKLKVNCFIHFHDIVIPQNYCKEWIESGNMFWNESYMLHAFLLFNESFQVIWGSKYMHINHNNKLIQQFPYFQPKHRITSFWIERIKKS